jgi:hypothetical protein
LLQAQNDYLDVYVNYEVLRRSLDFDLGTMQLAPNGTWIDPGPIGPEEGPPPVCLQCGPGSLPNGAEELSVPPPLRLPPTEVEGLPPGTQTPLPRGPFQGPLPPPNAPTPASPPLGESLFLPPPAPASLPPNGGRTS